MFIHIHFIHLVQQFMLYWVSNFVNDSMLLMCLKNDLFICGKSNDFNNFYYTAAANFSRSY